MESFILIFMFYGRLLWQPKDRVPSGTKTVFRVGSMMVSVLVAIAACSPHSTAAHLPMPVPTPSVPSAPSTVSVSPPVAGSAADEVTASPSAPSPAVSSQGPAERPSDSSPTNAGSQALASARRVVARPHATPQPSARPSTRQIPPLPLPSLKPQPPAGTIWSSATNIAWPPGSSPQGKPLVLQECTLGTCADPAPLATVTPRPSASG